MVKSDDIEPEEINTQTSQLRQLSGEKKKDTDRLFVRTLEQTSGHRVFHYISGTHIEHGKSQW